MAVDSHCHLDYEVFNEDRPEMMVRAKENGIHYMMTIGVELSKMPQVLAVAQGADNIFATAGIHPHEADNAPQDTAEQLRDYAKHPKVVGLGETGLDYYYGHSERHKQIACFKTHIQIAQETGLPLIVHTRDAEEDTVQILKEAKNTADFSFVIHCFSGTDYLAGECLALGGYISISGIITFKKAQELRDVVTKIPLERLLVETDSPYLAPLPHRGRRNEPAYTRYVLDTVAGLKSVSVEEVDRVTTDNYFSVFRKAKR